MLSAKPSRIINGGEWRLLGEYVEVETGKNNARPQLTKALAHCRMTGATFVVANGSAEPQPGVPDVCL